MKSVLRLALIAAVACAITPAAFAAGMLNPYYADIPSPVCGPVDADRACYYTSGGSGGCPKNTSYAKCMERCKCTYEAAIKDCAEGSRGIMCRDSARMSRNVCEGGCLSDWPPAMPPM